MFESPAHHRALILTWLDELDEASSILRSLCKLADERGEEGALPFLLASLGLVEYLAGRRDEASSTVAKAVEIAAQTGQKSQGLPGRAVGALVCASRGEVESARTAAEAALTSAEEHSLMIATLYAASAVGMLELSLGDPDAAHRRLGPLVERLEAGGVREPGSMPFVFDEVEALIGLGRLDEATTLLDRFEARARTLDRASSLAASLRCRGLLAAAHGDVDAAVSSLRRAIDEHERAPRPFERARTLLALGSAQRRARRRRDARATLTEALSIFERLGADVWAQNARAELGRIGGRAPATGDLTPTEARIAKLVADGKTNKEVAAALVVADHTVESALTQIYRKLDVRSRTELTRKLAGLA